MTHTDVDGLDPESEPERGSVAWVKWAARQREMQPTRAESAKLLATVEEQARRDIESGRSRGARRRRDEDPHLARRFAVCLVDAAFRAAAVLRGANQAARTRAMSGGPRGIERRPAGKRHTPRTSRPSSDPDGPGEPSGSPAAAADAVASAIPFNELLRPGGPTSHEREVVTAMGASQRASNNTARVRYAVAYLTKDGARQLTPGQFYSSTSDLLYGFGREDIDGARAKIFDALPDHLQRSFYKNLAATDWGER